MKSTDYQQPAADATTAQIAEHGRLSDFSQLIKTRLTFLVLVTTGVGFYVGTRGPVDLVRLFNVLVGAALAAAGASALNQWWERDLDALMSRTRMRPVPAGRMRAGSALILGCFMALIGIVHRRHLHPCLHPAEARYHDQHVGRRDSRRASASDRVGGSSRLARFRSLDFVRDRLHLANPTLLRHRLALSSRLRAGRISHALQR